MKYQIGDKIIVLHSDEEGTVIDLINDKMVMIEVRGVKFPAYMDQIDFPYFKMFTQKKPVQKQKVYVDNIRKEKPAAKQPTGNGVWLNFIPVFDRDVFDDDVVEKVKLFLVNHNSDEYSFSYTLYCGNTNHFELKNTIRGGTDFYLHDVPFEQLSDNPKFEFEFSLSKEDRKKAPYLETAVKLKGKQLFKKIEEIQLKNEPSFSYELFATYPDKVEEERVDLGKLGNAGFRLYDATRGREHLAPSRSVVDLHIEKLTDNYRQLTSYEMLTLQLDTFEKYYELAILHHLPEFTVIHGVGEGKLRDEIHERLRLKKEVKSFVNQYHSLYGFGATEIFFK